MERLKRLKFDEIVCYMIVLAACLKLPNALQDVGNTVYMLVIVLAFIYLVWKLFWKRDLFKNSLYIWAVVLCVTFLTSAAMNGSLFMIRNLRACVCGAIFFFVLVPQNGLKDREQWRKRIHVVNMIVIFSTLLYGISMLFFIFFKGHFYLINFSGSTITIGWNVGRIMGIYAEGSLAGYASFLSFAVSLVELNVLGKNIKTSTKILTWINLIVQAVCVAISCSRGAYLAMLIVLFLYLFICLKTKQTVISFIQASAISAVIGGGLLFGGIIVNIIPGIPIKPFCLNLPQKSFEWTNEDSEEEDKAVSMIYRITTGEQYAQETEPDIKETERKEETVDLLYKYTSGRNLIWKSGIEKMKKNPWFGNGLYSEDNFNIYSADGTKGAGSVVNYTSLHNDFVQAYVSGGIIGGSLFLLYLAVIILKAKRNWAKARQKSDEDRMRVRVICISICGIILTSLTLTVIYFDSFATGAVFWCYLGLLYNYTKIICEENTVKNNTV